MCRRMMAPGMGTLSCPLALLLKLALVSDAAGTACACNDAITQSTLILIGG